MTFSIRYLKHHLNFYVFLHINEPFNITSRANNHRSLAQKSRGDMACHGSNDGTLHEPSDNPG